MASNGREYLIDQSLTCLEEELDPDHFFCVNRQVMVNIDAVDHAAPTAHRKLRLSVTPPPSGRKSSSAKPAPPPSSSGWGFRIAQSSTKQKFIKSSIFPNEYHHERKILK